MSLTRFVRTFSVAVVVLGAGGVCAQGYPNKPIRVVTLGVGGGADFVSRLIAPGLSSGLGQPVVIDNRGAGVIPAEIVSKAPPDGYTLLLHGASLWITSLLQKTSYDTLRDFSPVTLMSKEVSVLVVSPSVPVTSVKDLIALAKAKPGTLNYGSTPIGTGSHLAVELLKSMAGVNFVRVPYTSSGANLSALLGGEVQLTIIGAAAVAPNVKAGKLKALAVTSTEPSALLPGVPPVSATVPGYEFISASIVMVPAKTPATIINRLNQEVVRVLNQADVKEKLLASGQEIIGDSPEEFAVWMKADIGRMSKVLKDAGIKVD